MAAKKVMLNTWPESQACCGCKHGGLVDSDNIGDSAYICMVDRTPDSEGVQGCSQFKDENERIRHF